MRVLLVDDHPVVLNGLERLIGRTRDLRVVGRAESVTEALAAEEPDVIVADLMLKEVRGAPVVSSLRARFPHVPILVLTMVDSPDQVSEAIRAGADGYLLKDAAAPELVEALRRVARGEEYVQPSLGSALARWREPIPTVVGPGGELTEREREVLQLLALGHTNAEIAEVLHVGLRTVEAHRSHVLRKLRARTRAQLVSHAIQLGLVPGDRTASAADR